MHFLTQWLPPTTAPDFTIVTKRRRRGHWELKCWHQTDTKHPSGWPPPLLTPHTRTHKHTHWQAQHTHTAKNGALVRLTQCGALTFPAIKKVIGKIPIKCVRKERTASQRRVRAQRSGGGGQESWMESLKWVEEKAQGGEVEVYSPPGWPLDTLQPPSAWKEKKHLASSTFSLTPLLFFFESCFHLAHGNAPSNAWVSQTKSYFLIHSLSHIIILLDRVSQLFFSGPYFLSFAFSGLGGWHHSLNRAKSGRKGWLTLFRSEVRVLPPVHTYLLPIC